MQLEVSGFAPGRAVLWLFRSVERSELASEITQRIHDHAQAEGEQNNRITTSRGHITAIHPDTHPMRAESGGLAGISSGRGMYRQGFKIINCWASKRSELQSIRN